MSSVGSCSAVSGDGGDGDGELSGELSGELDRDVGGMAVLISCMLLGLGLTAYIGPGSFIMIDLSG